MMRALILVAAAVLAGCATRPPSSVAEAPPKNIIVMISDGAGYAALRATRLWAGKPLAVEDPAFLHAPMAVTQLSTRNQPVPAPEGLAQDPELVFTPGRACDATPVPGETPALYGLNMRYPNGFQGYVWNRRTAPDSANTMSALMTGVRSYTNAINVDGTGAPLRTLAQAAAASGRAVGVVTTASISDATPAAGAGAHAPSRAMRAEIAAQMFGNGRAVVIAGAGNPDWTNDATPAARPTYAWIGRETWQALKAGLPVPPANVRWTLIEEAEPVRAMAAGAEPVPERLAVVAKAVEGTQQYRGGLGPSTDPPFATPLLAAQPALADMAVAALRRLEREPGGFFLVIEESNTDRASHANNLGRVIEARLAFEAAIERVVAHLGPRMAETLLVVTSDHDHLLTGPEGARVAFQPVEDRGAGVLPGHRWLGNGHSNLPVPLFVRGPGAKRLLAATDGGPVADGRAPVPPAACPVTGPVLDQAAVGRALLALVDAPRR
ncbi:alkaline phosphatase [Thermaurantiacus sp.]